MARLRGIRTRVGMAGLVYVAVACGPTVDKNDGEGPAATCASIEDCERVATACRTAAACAEGACVFHDVEGGTPSADQAAGDCQQAVCDGTGGVKMVPLENDPPDDGNVCTLDTCEGATPKHTPQIDALCTTGLPGICSSGVQKCDAQGNPVGGCVGALPAKERCDADAIDEDCDAHVNEEGEGCTCSDGFLSAGEECDDGGVKPGDGCSATCQLERVEQLAAGEGHSCALLHDGSVKCWGWNDYGQLGLGDTARRGDGKGEMGDKLSPVDLGAGKKATAIAAGAWHTCALLVEGSVKCWGHNDFGQLGQGDTNSRGDGPGEMGDKLLPIDLGAGKKATAIVAGAFSMCARLSEGSIKCWGSNGGQLGLGDGKNRGDAPGQMGDALPAVDLGVGKKAFAIALGELHACALLDDGSVKCWGGNGHGELGLGDTETRGDAPGEMGDALPAVDLGAGKAAKALALGVAHTCALRDDGSVKCWGANGDGQLGLGEEDDRGNLPGQMGEALPPVDLGTGKAATALTAGFRHTCAALTEGGVKCWGNNKDGGLGLGDTETRGHAPGQMGDALPAVSLGAGKEATGIEAGDFYTCAVLKNGRAKCWGQNFFGQLGQGDTAYRGDGPGEMGDELPAVKLYSDAW